MCSQVHRFRKCGAPKPGVMPGGKEDLEDMQIVNTVNVVGPSLSDRAISSVL